MNQNKLLSSYFLLVLAPLFWSGNFVMGRFMHNDIPPFTFAFFRWFFVIVILLPLNFSNLIKNIAEIKKHFLSLIMLSILSVVIYTSFVYLGLHYTSALSASLVNASVPVLIVLLSSLLIRDTLTGYKLMGIVLSLLGVLFILTKGDLSAIAKMHYDAGDPVILIAATSWAFFSVLYKKLEIKIPPFLFLLITAIIGDSILFPCAMLEHHLGYVMHYNWLSFASIFYAALFSSVLAFTFWNMGVKAVGPGVAAYFFNLLPVFGSILAIVFLGEKMQIYHLYGCFFVFSGIFLATKKSVRINRIAQAR